MVIFKKWNSCAKVAMGNSARVGRGGETGSQEENRATLNCGVTLREMTFSRKCKSSQ